MYIGLAEYYSQTTLWTAKSGKMLASRCHPLGRFDVRSPPRSILQTANKRRADLPSQKGVFTKVLLDSSPPQLTRKVEDGGEHMVDAESLGFGGGNVGDSRDESGVEGGSETDGRGEDGAFVGKAVETCGIWGRMRLESN